MARRCQRRSGATVMSLMSCRLGSGDCVCEYASEEDFDAGNASQTIYLEDQDIGGDDRWVIVDQTGAVMYENDEFELGWRHEEDARHEARGLESRGEGRWQVVRG